MSDSVRNFEIFMQNVPFGVRHADLVRCLAEVLHAPPFLSEEDQLMNFDVHLHRDKKQKNRHSGRGSLTLPNASASALFLGIYGVSDRPHLPCDLYTHVGGRRMTFTFGNKPIKDDVLQFIISTPYKDPWEIVEQQERTEQLQGGINFTSLQFGWQCRDDSFSTEWNALHYPEGPLGSNPQLAFVQDTNEVNISLGNIDDLYDPFPFNYSVVFRFSRVESLAYDNIHSSHPGILFTFTCPPAFESVYPPDGRTPNRYRLQFFPGDHQRVAPFTSYAMRIECYSPADFNEFKRKARTVHLPPAMVLPSGPVQRDLFSEWNLACVNSWIQSLEWDIAFQVQAILYNLCLDPVELLDLSDDIHVIRRECGLDKTKEILVLFNSRIRMLPYEEGEDNGPHLIRRTLNKAREDATDMHMNVRLHYKNPDSFDCLHVNVTPSRLILDGPYPDQSNRVLRQFPNHQHCFLRVCFTDEEMLGYRWDREVDGAAFVRRRVGGLLKDPAGLEIAGRVFSFLAYSSSALRERAVWFVRPFRDDNGQDITADSIRRNLGDFSHLEFYPARMGARMSQAFTATEPSIRLDIEDEIVILPDIERNGSNFTDGVGEISKAVAKKIARSLQKRPGSKKRFFIRPSAYQFRAGGFKGVIAINYELKDMEIRMRKSQKKFDAPVVDIEIAQSFYRPKPVYLNRSLIMILETLGVSQSSFIELQDAAVAEVEAASQTLEKCADFLDIHGCGTSFHLSSVFMNLHKIGVGLSNESAAFTLSDPFLDQAIEFATTHVLRGLKHKARIPIKGSYTLVGIADVHGYLEPNEVFVCIQNRDSKPTCLKGKVLVTRSPQVHPGDVQFVHAIGRPPPGSPFTHEYFPNCIVFSTRGDRSVPSMLAGGDLDGDEFNVILLPSLHPRVPYPPAEYPPATLNRLDHPCGVKDLADWVAEYINSDILGLVSSQFLIRADQSKLMARDPGCIVLAELCSKAVDFAKSGTPVDRNDMPLPLFPPSHRPDWSTGEIDNSRSGSDVYLSQRALGVLYRRIDLSDVERKAAREASKQHGSKRAKQEKKEAQQLSQAMETLNVSGPSHDMMNHPVSSALRPFLRSFIDVDSSIPIDITSVAQRQYEAYASELRCICSASTLTMKPLTEEEVLMGTITARTSQPRKRQSMQARLRRQTDDTLKAIRMQLSGKNTSADEDDEEDLEDRLLRAWAAWQISVVQGHALGGKSFGIVALFAIFECARAIEERDQ